MKYIQILDGEPLIKINCPQCKKNVLATVITKKIIFCHFDHVFNNEIPDNLYSVMLQDIETWKNTSEGKRLTQEWKRQQSEKITIKPIEFKGYICPKCDSVHRSEQGVRGNLTCLDCHSDMEYLEFTLFEKSSN